jgi:phosphatidylserine synthase
MTRIETASVKYFPIVANGVLLVLMLFQLFDIELRTVVSYMTGCAIWPAVNLIIQSSTAHFCAWHRVLIYNIIFYAFLQLLDRFGIGFSFYLYIALIVSFAVFLLSGWLYYKHGCNSKMADHQGVGGDS